MIAIVCGLYLSLLFVEQSGDDDAREIVRTALFPRPNSVLSVTTEFQKLTTATSDGGDGGGSRVEWELHNSVES